MRAGVQIPSVRAETGYSSLGVCNPSILAGRQGEEMGEFWKQAPRPASLVNAVEKPQGRSEDSPLRVPSDLHTCTVVRVHPLTHK